MLTQRESPQAPDYRRTVSLGFCQPLSPLETLWSPPRPRPASQANIPALLMLCPGDIQPPHLPPSLHQSPTSLSSIIYLPDCRSVSVFTPTGQARPRWRNQTCSFSRVQQSAYELSSKCLLKEFKSHWLLVSSKQNLTMAKRWRKQGFRHSRSTGASLLRPVRTLIHATSFLVPNHSSDISGAREAVIQCSRKPQRSVSKGRKVSLSEGLIKSCFLGQTAEDPTRLRSMEREKL